MRKFVLPASVFLVLCCDVRAAEPRETMPWSPAVFGQGLTLWLDGDDVDGNGVAEGLDEGGVVGGKVSAWRDKSPRRQVLVQEDATLQPTLREGLGGRKTLHFGVDNQRAALVGEDVSLGMGQNEMTYAAVVRCAEGGSTILRQWFTVGPPRPLAAHFDPKGVLSFGISHRYAYSTDRSYLNVPMVVVSHTRHAQKGIISGYVNGRLAGQGDDPNFDPTRINQAKIMPVTVGTDNQRFLFKGEIAEIVVCRFKLSDEERGQLEGYLAHKWDLAGHLPEDHPCKNNPPAPTSALEQGETEVAALDASGLPPYQPEIARAPVGRGYPRWPNEVPEWKGDGPEPWSLEWYEQVAWEFGSWHRSFHPAHRHDDWLTYDQAWARKYFPLPEWRPDFSGVDFDRVSPQTDPPGVHPRLYFSPADIPAIMERIQGSRWGRHYWESLKLQTDDFFTETYEYKGETRINPLQAFVDGTATYEDRSYGVSSQMMINALRAVLEGDRVRGERVGKMLHHWAKLHREKMDEGGWNICGPYRIWHGFCVTYDLAYPFLTEAQRRDVRKVIARAITRPSPYIDLLYGVNVPRPSHNWMSLVTMPVMVGYMAIEGEEGYDPFYTWKMAEGVERWLTFFWSEKGVSYESMGKNQANLHYLIPLARRGNWLVTHPHIRKAVDNFYLYALQPWGRYLLTSGSFASSEAMLRQPDCMVTKFLLPDDPRVDFVYRNAMGSPPAQPEGRRAGPFPGVGEATLGMEHILFASDWEGMDDPGPLADGFAKLGLDPDFFDPERALYVARSDWSQDALQVRMSSEQQATAKLKPDAGGLYLSALGRVWGKQSGDRKASGYSVVTVDGTEHPFPYARILSYHSEEDFSYAVNDWSPAYNGYVKGAEERSPVDNDFRVLKPTSYPGGNIAHNIIWNRPWLRLDTENPYSLYYWKNQRELHLEAHRHQYGIESLPVLDTALRTLVTVRGKQPYLLVHDVIRPSDAGTHSFTWRFTLEDGIEWDQRGHRDEIRLRDVDTDRRLLIRMLQAPVDYTVTVARVKNDFSGADEQQVQVEGAAERLDLAVLILPYREGEELPRTTMHAPTGRLQVAFTGQQDVWIPRDQYQPIPYQALSLERTTTETTATRVAVKGSAVPLREDGGNVQSFLVERSGDLSYALRVYPEWLGTFNEDDLATGLPTEIEIGRGQRSVAIPVRAKEDDLFENTESILLRMKSGTGYIVSGSPARIQIADNEPIDKLWTPERLGEDLTVWLDANDIDGDGEAEGLGEEGLEGRQVRVVKDKSGRANHVSQADINRAPFLNQGGMAAKDTLHFDGTHRYLTNVLAVIGEGGHGLTYFAVIRPKTTLQVWMMWMKVGDGMCGQVLSRGLGTDVPAGAVGVGRNHREGFAGSRSVFDQDVLVSAVNRQVKKDAMVGFIDGALAGRGDDPFFSGQVFSGPLKSVTVGSENDRFRYEGEVAELIVVNRALGDAQRLQVEGYLAHKWNLAGRLPANHPFRQAAPMGEGDL